MVAAGRPRARIKDAPEDFIVEELPLYEPEGTGEHLFVRFTKRELTTDDVVRALARASGVQARDIGVAGLKDKVGVTTQTVSLPVPRAELSMFDAKVLALAIPGVVIHEAKRHELSQRRFNFDRQHAHAVDEVVEERRAALALAA